MGWIQQFVIKSLWFVWRRLLGMQMEAPIKEDGGVHDSKKWALASLPKKTTSIEARPEGQKCCTQTLLLKTWDAKNKLHHIRVKLTSWGLLECVACFYVFFLIQVTTVARTTSPSHRWCQTLSPTCLIQAEFPFNYPRSWWDCYLHA